MEVGSLLICSLEAPCFASDTEVAKIVHQGEPGYTIFEAGWICYQHRPIRGAEQDSNYPIEKNITSLYCNPFLALRPSR